MEQAAVKAYKALYSILHNKHNIETVDKVLLGFHWNSITKQSWKKIPWKKLHTSFTKL